MMEHSTPQDTNTIHKHHPLLIVYVGRGVLGQCVRMTASFIARQAVNTLILYPRDLALVTFIGVGSAIVAAATDYFLIPSSPNRGPNFTH